MGSTFNPQILAEKLSKFNRSQQSIETLSHWFIFHMNMAKQVVETLDKQFHYSPHEQQLAFLYLANDILQNNRRKGSEFVSKFWKVLPNALRDVIENGDEFGRNAALRLISIWEERKVFGSRGKILKEELTRRPIENSNRNGKDSGFKLRHSAGNALDQITSCYQVLYSGQLDEDAILKKCRNAISCIEKVDKEIGDDHNPGMSCMWALFNGSGIMEELQGQNAILKDCIEYLTTVESSRTNLVSHLRDALQEQITFNHTQSSICMLSFHGLFQDAQPQSEQVDNLCRRLLNTNVQLLAEQSMKETRTSKTPHSFITGNGEQSAPVMYTRMVPLAEKPGEDPKAAAAAMAAKLTASTASAQMLSYVLSSLASEGVIGNPIKEYFRDFPSEKRTRLDNDHHSFKVPPRNSQPPFLLAQKANQEGVELGFSKLIAIMIN
ncbi:uncharacterized protein LOC130777102 [Actinidia eriantha]|uniref:uncharacterized protein LOC130777102 n=1 Tax=Actinidia eriantha TaxID=165200 RepID=UPI00258BA658|nr:uncharacterized protein LOC130777102 [Actinidia eriantha]